MQNVSFNNLDEFFDFLPENELKILRFIRQIVLECIPGCKEKLSYNVPFYARHSNICFLWPASVSWGSVKQKGAVRMGFTKGYLLHDEIQYLERGDRKQVCWKEFSDIREVDIDLLKSYLFEAVEIDQSTRKIRRKV